jgi:hypothetical protein
MGGRGSGAGVDDGAGIEAEGGTGGSGAGGGVNGGGGGGGVESEGDGGFGSDGFGGSFMASVVGERSACRCQWRRRGRLRVGAFQETEEIAVSG